MQILVGVQGFEPWTPWSQTRCATGLRYTPRREIIAYDVDLVKLKLEKPALIFQIFIFRAKTMRL